MNIRKTLFPVLCTALVSLTLTTGCYKGDGTETRPTGSNQNNPSVNILPPDVKEGTPISDLSPDVKAKTDAPFPFSADDAKKPDQDILLVLLYEEFGNSYKQTVNYYDVDGYVYRFRSALNLKNDDWVELLEQHRDQHDPVGMMGDVERDTLRYLANHAEDYEDATLKQQTRDGDLPGCSTLYVISEDNEPIEIASYANTCTYRNHEDIIAFANWFRYFYHGDVVFGS